jgi:uncharacterized protein YidB (DUF937 family)
MGLLDDVLNKSTPGGDLSKPLMIALGTLLVSSMFKHGETAPSVQPSTSPQINADAGGNADGGLLGGIGGLLNQLKTSGLGDHANSWVGSGSNKQVDPGQLGSALGQSTVSTAAQQSGLSEQELLQQLAQKLPGLVDQLTANGRMPTLQDIANALTQPQQQPR